MLFSIRSFASMSAIKSLTLGIVICSQLLGTFLMPLIYLDYEIRKDYIAEFLCIERDKPITVCYGSCVLSKNLQTAQDTQEDSEKLIPKEFSFFCHMQRSLAIGEVKWQVLQNSTPQAYDEEIPGDAFTFDIFHPPRV